jgi:energy-coupling factor transporter transmembrane protein EcfT
MFQILFLFIQLIIALGFALVGLIFLVITVVMIVKKKTKKQLAIFITATVIPIILSILVFNYDLSSAESSNRDQIQPYFTSYFGLNIPQNLEIIRAKKWALYDTEAHWMCFSYEASFFNQMISSDSLLSLAKRNTFEYNEIVSQLERGDANHPSWLELPNEDTPVIYFKRDFMNHSFSEYYLWVDESKQMVYFETSYFD